jgi:hypothetical protein
MTDVMSGEQDWRLKAELDLAVGAVGAGGIVGGASGAIGGGAGGGGSAGGEGESGGGLGGALEHLLGRLRGGLRGGSGVGGADRGGSEVVHEAQAAIPHDVVLTHDGSLLFAYAANQETITATRRALESVLSHDGIEASIYVSHWDDALDAWRQIDPPSTGGERVREEAAVRDAEAIETRTLVASSGKMIRAEFEQSMLAWAAQLGVQCETIEHPHLLTTQIGFTITGPRRKLDEFASGLKAEEAATIRTERAVMLSPL